MSPNPDTQPVTRRYSGVYMPGKLVCDGDAVMLGVFVIDSEIVVVALCETGVRVAVNVLADSVVVGDTVPDRENVGVSEIVPEMLGVHEGDVDGMSPM